MARARPGLFCPGNLRQSLHCDWQTAVKEKKAVDVEMEDIRLPGPQTKIVMFGNNLFKLKYKLSLKAAGHPLSMTKTIQDDIKGVTEAILNLYSSTGKLAAIRTDNLVIFPSSLAWNKAVCSQLHFSYNGQKLQPHPQIIFLLVHILTPVSPKTPITQIQTSTNTCVTPCRLGKRLQPATHPDDETLPLMTGIPSSIILARKRLKLENGEQSMQAQIPQDSGSTASLPTESAQCFSMMNKPKRHPDVEHIAQCAEETKKRFRELSQPSKAVTITEDHDTEDTSTTQQRSVFQKFVGSVKSFLGWY